MSWQNGMQQNNSWYGTPYANYGPYGCPPGSGYPGAPFPPPGWPGYGPFGNYQFTGTWPYGVPPNMQGNFVPAADQPTDQTKQDSDVSKINPPLPPDPPPGEPPKIKEENKEEKKEETKPENEKEKKPDTKDEAVKTEKTEEDKQQQKQETNVAPTFNFDPSQFTVPPPPTNCYPMYHQNPWFNPAGFPNAPFPLNPMANANTANANQNVNGPIRFSINNKKGSLQTNTSQQSVSSGMDKKDQDVSKSSNETTTASSNSPKNKKKNKQPWENDNSDSVTNISSQNNDLNSSKTNTNFQSSSNPPKIPKRCHESSIMSSGDWPESLKRYVERCFARCVTELDKDQVEICLKGKLTLAAHNESLWKKNWDQETLINVHSVAVSGEKKDSFNGRIFNSRKFEGDPSRGFTVIRRSRSRSRSSSPYSSDGRRRRDRRRHSSSESDDKLFIGFKSRPGRGRGGQRGRGGKKKGKAQGNHFQGSENSYFYSKSGSMTLDADLCTDERLQKRAARFANQRGGRGGGGGGGVKGNVNKKKKNMNLSLTINNAFSVDGDNIDWTSMHIVGTSTIMEKEYLRLTSAPEPSTIRTVHTLKKALNHVKNQWKKNKDYFYTCNQLKSIRQDLTVQGIRDDFTIEVYETHCRIALEKGDHEEFNQCQTQLKDLYYNRGGTNRMEFISYRLLYYIFTQNTLDITSMLASLTENEKKNSCIAFALKLRAAWSLSNFHQFFKLYQNAPLMTGFLIDWFAKRERERAIKILIKSYRPGNLCVDFVKSTLALSGEDWGTFVEEYKLVFTDNSNKNIDCKKSALALLLA